MPEIPLEVAAAAAQLGLTRQALHHYIQTGKLEAVRHRAHVGYLPAAMGEIQSRLLHGATRRQRETEAMTSEKNTLAPRSSRRGLNDRIKDVLTVERTGRTITFLASTATMVVGILLMLITRDSTVHLLAACLVANEAAKETR
jgi:hypothetical protein